VRLARHRLLIGDRLFRRKLQAAPHLLGQPVQGGIEGIANEEVDAFVGQVGTAVMGREQRRLQAVDDGGQRLARRQLAHAP
jgi:hypothetical protein